MALTPPPSAPPAAPTAPGEPPQRSNPGAFRALADAFVVWQADNLQPSLASLTTWLASYVSWAGANVTELGALQTDVATKQGTASAAAAAASGSATAAAGSASAAAGSATTASSARDEAVTAVPPVQVASYTALRAYAGVALSVQVTSIGFAGTFTRDDADTTSADNGGTVIVASNGKRWKRVFGGAVSAEWFGAKGDGTTDDTAAIAAAMDAVSTAFDTYSFYSREVRGATLCLTPGKHYAVDQLTPKGNVTVVAYGSRLLHNAAASKPLLNVTYASMGLRWYGGMLVAKMSAVNPTSALLKLDATSGNLMRIAIRDVDLIGGESDTLRYATAGLHLLAVPGVNGIYECEFSNISARFVNGAGHKLDCNSLVGNRFLNNNTFTNSDIRNCALGIDMIGSEGNNFIGGAIQACTGKAIKFRNCRANEFVGVWIEANNTGTSTADDPFDIDFTDAANFGSNCFVGGQMITQPPRAYWGWWKHFSPGNVNHRGSATGTTDDSQAFFSANPNTSAVRVNCAIGPWAASTAYVAQTCIQGPNTKFTTGFWECTTAGTSGASPPAWPASPSAGTTQADNTVVWTFRVGAPYPSLQLQPQPARIMGTLGPSTTTEWELMRIKSAYTAGANTVMTAGPGLNVTWRTNSSDWDGGHLMMNLFHLWADAFGVMRYKSSVPSSATDGFPFGTKVAVPGSATSSGAPGQWAVDTTNFYVYTGDGTTHTWRRVAVAAF